MKTKTQKALITAILLTLATTMFAQKSEICRFELHLSSKSSQCDFLTLDRQGTLVVAETDNQPTKDTREWLFALLDTNLVQQTAFSTPFNTDMRLNSLAASNEMAAAVFASSKRNDSTSVSVVIYDRTNDKFNIFDAVVEPNASLLNASLCAHTLALAYNLNGGGSNISFFDLTNGNIRHRRLDSNHLIHNIEATAKNFVANVKVFDNRHATATDFMVFSQEGTLLKSYTYPNKENTTIGKSCSIVKDNGDLHTFAMIERKSNTKVNAKDFARNYDKEVIGIIAMQFNKTNNSNKTYLFKDIPDIDKALTPNNRLRVKQRQAALNDTTKTINGEIAFNLLNPSVLIQNDTIIMAVEAFTPIFHTETRMEYGYFGATPTTYTIFDGYDFYSLLAFAFNNNEMLWQNHCNFDNPTDENLKRHITEVIANNDILVMTSNNNSLEYSIIDINGNKLLNNERLKLPMMEQNDILDTEFTAGTRHWYDNKIIVFGKQLIRNRMTRKANKLVFFLQKTQYE